MEVIDAISEVLQGFDRVLDWFCVQVRRFLRLLEWLVDGLCFWWHVFSQ